MQLKTENEVMMDQSTQVSFPIVARYQMRRHNTSADLFLTNNNNNNNNNTRGTVTTWNAARLGITRPRSVKSLSEQLMNDRKKQLAHYYQQNNRLPTPVSDFHLSPIGGSISRDRTPPPFSSTSSSTDSICQHCHHLEKRSYDMSSQEGLSWRRLHMSRAKLKATATTSELLSGFAMIAMVELQINDPTHVPEWLFVMFAVCTTVLVAVHIFALMISTYILPNVDAIAKLDMCEMVAESPHERMRGFIEIAWLFSTVLGLFLFLVEVAILCWVKFWDYSFTAATAATIIVIPVLVVFLCFAVHFYHSLVVYKFNTSQHEMEKLDDMRKQLDEASTSPV